MNCKSFKDAGIRLAGSRRWSISALAIVALTLLGIVNKIDVQTSIAAVAAAVAASNSYQKSKQPVNTEQLQ